MGYTHYWKQQLVDEDRWLAAIAKANKVVKKSPVRLADGTGEGRLVIKKDCIVLNDANEPYETFAISNSGTDFDFCKTARHDYDVVVVAVLAIMHNELGDAFLPSSDGDRAEWADGVELACEVTGEDIQAPDRIRNYD